MLRYSGSLIKTMEILEQCQAFVHNGDDLVFHSTKLILGQNEDQYFYASTERRLVSKSDLPSLELHKIPTDDIWPDFDPRFTRAPEPLPPNSYVKRPSLLQYGDTAAPLNIGSQLLSEVEICEILRRHPHPNIAQYLGCIVKDGQIRGLVFVKYPTTLTQLLKDGTPFDKHLCLLGIQSGVGHLHRLHLVHNDLKPSNIMIDGDRPVIIDFDSCKQEGERLGLKAGTLGWAKDNSEFATRENDIYSISKIGELLSCI